MTGIPSMTVHRLLSELDEPETGGLTDRSVRPPVSGSSSSLRRRCTVIDGIPVISESCAAGLACDVEGGCLAGPGGAGNQVDAGPGAGETAHDRFLLVAQTGMHVERCENGPMIGDADARVATRESGVNERLFGGEHLRGRPTLRVDVCSDDSPVVATDHVAGPQPIRGAGDDVVGAEERITKGNDVAHCRAAWQRGGEGLVHLAATERRCPCSEHLRAREPGEHTLRGRVTRARQRPDPRLADETSEGLPVEAETVGSLAPLLQEAFLAGFGVLDVAGRVRSKLSCPGPGEAAVLEERLDVLATLREAPQHR